MLALGVPIRVVMNLLGRSQLAVTVNTYSLTVPEMQRNATARVGTVLRGKTPTWRPRWRSFGIRGQRFDCKDDVFYRAEVLCRDCGIGGRSGLKIRSVTSIVVRGRPPPDRTFSLLFADDRERPSRSVPMAVNLAVKRRRDGEGIDLSPDSFEPSNLWLSAWLSGDRAPADVRTPAAREEIASASRRRQT